MVNKYIRKTDLNKYYESISLYYKCYFEDTLKAAGKLAQKMTEFQISTSDSNQIRILL